MTHITKVRNGKLARKEFRPNSNDMNNFYSKLPSCQLSNFVKGSCGRLLWSIWNRHGIFADYIIIRSIWNYDMALVYWDIWCDYRHGPQSKSTSTSEIGQGTQTSCQQLCACGRQSVRAQSNGQMIEWMNEWMIEMIEQRCSVSTTHDTEKKPHKFADLIICMHDFYTNRNIQSGWLNQFYSTSWWNRNACRVWSINMLLFFIAVFVDNL